MTIELTEDQINSYPAGRELDALIWNLFFQSGEDYQFDEDSWWCADNNEPYRINSYSADNSLVQDVCNRAIEKLGLYQVTYIENHRIDHSSEDAPMLRVFYAFDGVAKPWGWGETQALAACRFALKALLYRQMNIESGAWPKC